MGGLAERAYQIIQQKRMKNINKQQLKEEIMLTHKEGNFNIYAFAQKISTQ